MSPNLSQTELFFWSSGTPINKRPVLGYRNLNLFKLYRLVHKLGGFDNVSAPKTGTPICCSWTLATLVSCNASPSATCLSRLKVAPFGSRSTRILASLCSTQPLATMSNVLTASKYRCCLYGSSELLGRCSFCLYNFPSRPICGLPSVFLGVFSTIFYSLHFSNISY